MVEISGPERFSAAAEALGIEIQLHDMLASTRTAEEAAAVCGCAVGQIVKSLIFQTEADGALRLLLVSGENRVDPQVVAAATGEVLERADPKRVRAETGFAIGGVPPFGHVISVPVAMDRDLMRYDIVWAAAGGPSAVFSISPKTLHSTTAARLIAVTE